MQKLILKQECLAQVLLKKPLTVGKKKTLVTDKQNYISLAHRNSL